MKVYVYFVTISYYIEDPFDESGAHKESSMCEISTPYLVDSIEKLEQIINEIKKNHTQETIEKVIIQFYNLLRIEEITESEKLKIKVKFMNEY